MRHFLRVVSALFLLVGTWAYSAEDAVYTLVDDSGEVHLSNVPDNDRYAKIEPPLADATARAPPRRAKVAASRSCDRLPYCEVIMRVAGEFGIEPALLHAVISVESGYNANALSKSGAGGLMQLMPQTARRYGVTDVFDPADNVRAGARYLADLLKLFDNNLELALAAYSAGESAVIKYGKRIPPYPETAAYVPRVVGSYNRMRMLM